MAILSFYSIGQYTIWAYIGEAMKWKEDGIEWVADGKRVQIWLTRVGSGLLLLPALISISTRKAMRPLGTDRVH